MKVKDFENYVFLVGAGISVNEPSGIPVTQNVIHEIFHWLSDPSTETYNTLLSKSKPDKGSNPFDFIRFETAIEKISAIEPEIFDWLASLETSGYPNAYHLLLADAISRGGYVITTNFDNRIELALSFLGADDHCTVLGEDTELFRSSNYLKIHGSFPYGKNGRTKPKAGLREIGETGFCYDAFPDLRKWFLRITTGKTLVVLGYSASDSFDVVPLIEEFCGAETIEWFIYNPTQKQYTTQEIVKSDENLLPSKKTTDFAKLCLERLNYFSPKSNSYLVSSSDLDDFLNRKFPEAFSSASRNAEKIALNDSAKNPHRQLNLLCFHSNLEQNPLTNDEKTIILESILDDGSFGKGFTIGYGYPSEKTEMGHLFRKTHQAVIENRLESHTEFLKQEKSKYVGDLEEYSDYLEAMAYAEIESGEVNNGFMRLREVALLTGDDLSNSELLLLLDESEYCKHQETGNLPYMQAVSARTLQDAKSGGLIWGCVLYHWMKAFEIELQIYQESKVIKVSHELIDETIFHTKRVIYFGVRCGRQDWYSDALRLLARINMDFRTGNASKLLERHLNWIDDENVEERCVTLCNLITISANMQETAQTQSYIDKLQRVPKSLWKRKDVFTNIANAEIHLSQERYGDSLHCLKLAEDELTKLADGDPWSQRQVIKRMRSILMMRLAKNANPKPWL